jgi:hypothetical protein
MNYSIIFLSQEQQLCARGEKRRTEEINKELQLTPRSQAILDYVHRSLKNDEGKLNPTCERLAYTCLDIVN